MTPSIPAGWAVDLSRARSVECAAGGAGAFGAVVKVQGISSGPYLVVTDAPAAIRDTDTDTLRASGTQQLEPPFRADVPMPVMLRGPTLAVAAYGGTPATVWLLPLVPMCG